MVFENSIKQWEGNYKKKITSNTIQQPTFSSNKDESKKKKKLTSILFSVLREASSNDVGLQKSVFAGLGKEIKLRANHRRRDDAINVSQFIASVLTKHLDPEDTVIAFKIDPRLGSMVIKGKSSPKRFQQLDVTERDRFGLNVASSCGINEVASLWRM